LIIVSALPIISIQKIYEFVQESSAKRALENAALGPKITMSDFSIHWLSAFLFSFITWIGVLFFTNYLIGMFVGATSELSDSPPTFYFVVFGVLPLRMIAAAYIGRWIGTRSRPYVLAIVIGAIVLGFIAISVRDSNALSDTDMILSITFGQLFFIIPAALGFWFGQRQKPAYYLAFILNVLPEQTRQTIVEMAQDEAKRAHRPAIKASS
jgi:hypothetical protein